MARCMVCREKASESNPLKTVTAEVEGEPVFCRRLCELCRGALLEDLDKYNHTEAEVG